MNRIMGIVFVCSLGLFACNVENYEDCKKDDDFADDFGGSHHGGSTGHAGTKATDDGGTSSGGAGNTHGGSGAVGNCAGADDTGEAGAGAAPSTPAPTSCDDEPDCPAGYNCDHDAGQCQAADEETCGELKTEAACTHRSDCTPVYAGTNCSCGQDCACKGGEPGCVCESFAFFVCQAAQ